ncbi:MAG: hypothetical protein ACI9MR_001510 [Myxococcota bacterium]|jgi:hypothetical protein
MTSACGDDAVVARGGGTDTADTTANDTGTQPVGTGREIIVLHDTDRALQVTVTQTVKIRAKVIDYAVSGPAPNVAVNATLIPSADPAASGDASLNTLQSYTNEAGLAEFEFRANTVAGASYTIELTSTGADPVRFEVLVTDAPRGSIAVALQYEGPVSVKNVHIQLVTGQFTCGQFNPVYPPEQAFADKTLLGVTDGDVRFDNLPEGERFTVVATAESQNGSLAAAGCLDGIVVLAEQDNRVTLTMFLLVLNPSGVYDSASVFDFTGAIPGQVGNIVNELSTLFTSPGTFLIDRVKDLAALYVGEFITNVVFGFFEDAVADIINDWMFNNSPQWVMDILTVGQDLFQVVNRLEMLAQLRISKLQNDYYVAGRLLWNGLVLTWRYGCPDVGEAGYDPDCGRNVFTLEQFQNTQFPMDIIEGSFTASIQNFDKLNIDNHTIRLNYGKLIIFVLNELILPALTGEHTLLDAVLSFINCASIAEGIGGFSAIGISEQDVEDFCVDGISLIITPVTLILGNLAIDSQLRLSGTGTLVDDDNDLRVDRIINGAFVGNFESDGQQGSPFTGVWGASKNGP